MIDDLRKHCQKYVQRGDDCGELARVVVAALEGFITDCPWTSGPCKRPDCKKGCRAFQAYHDADMGNVRRGER